MSDRMVELQSKLATALLTGAAKAFKVEPTIPGLITSMGGEPEKVFELVRFVQENGARLTGAFEAAVTQTAARVARMEIEQQSQRAMLILIAQRLDIPDEVIGRLFQQGDALKELSAPLAAE